jgi:hypothetical protein
MLVITVEVEEEVARAWTTYQELLNRLRITMKIS